MQGQQQDSIVSMMKKGQLQDTYLSIVNAVPAAGQLFKHDVKQDQQLDITVGIVKFRAISRTVL